MAMLLESIGARPSPADHGMDRPLGGGGDASGASRTSRGVSAADGSACVLAWIAAAMHGNRALLTLLLRTVPTLSLRRRHSPGRSVECSAIRLHRAALGPPSHGGLESGPPKHARRGVGVWKWMDLLDLLALRRLERVQGRKGGRAFPCWEAARAATLQASPEGSGVARRGEARRERGVEGFAALAEYGLNVPKADPLGFGCTPHLPQQQHQPWRQRRWQQHWQRKEQEQQEQRQEERQINSTFIASTPGAAFFPCIILSRHCTVVGRGSHTLARPVRPLALGKRLRRPPLAARRSPHYSPVGGPFSHRAASSPPSLSIPPRVALELSIPPSLAPSLLGLLVRCLHSADPSHLTGSTAASSPPLNHLPLVFRFIPFQTGVPTGNSHPTSNGKRLIIASALRALRACVHWPNTATTTSSGRLLASGPRVASRLLFALRPPFARKLLTPPTRSMHEEPIDRSRDLWIERKRRYEQEEAARREEVLDARYRSAHESSNRFSPPRQAQHEPRYAQQLPPSALQNPGARPAASPRSQLPPNAPLSDEDPAMRADEPSVSALKRRRLGDALDRDDRRRDEAGSGGRSPPFRRADGAPNSGHRFLDERDAYADDLRSPLNPPYPSRSNGRVSPLERSAHSPASGVGPLPPMQEAHRPSVFSTSSYDDGPDHPSSMPGLARRRGDAAQAKASRLHIDTGNASSFEAAALVKSSSGIAKSAPPQKLSFGFDSRDHPMPQDQAPRESSLRPNLPSQLSQSSSHARSEQQQQQQQQHQQQTQQRLVSGSRQAEEAFRRDEREEMLGLRDGRMPEMPHTANPLARQPPSSRLPPGHVPQTATLPSPAYHTTQFARAHVGGRQAFNPPPTARLPDHLRSPPASKAHFLSLFSDFYDSLYDSRTLKATLEDQIKRSNTLLQTLQSSRRVLEETVERRVREERVLWEGRVRGLEARVRELEAKTGTADYDDAPSRPAEASIKPPNSASTAGSRSAAALDAGKESPESRERARSSASAPDVKKSSGSIDEHEGDELQDD